MERGLTGDLAAQLLSASHQELVALEGALDLLQRAIADLNARLPGNEPLRGDSQMPIWEDDAPNDGVDAPARSGALRQPQLR